jgi:hypothetical protein
MVGERKVTQALLTHDHHLIRAGRVNLGGEGFAGRNFERFVTEGRETRFGKLGGIRQRIEIGLRHPQKASSPSKTTAGAPLKASAHASRDGFLPSPQR